MLKKIRELSKERGISLTFICKRLGVASVYFIDIEKQNRTIPDDKLKIIADTLFTTVEYLKGITDNKNISIATQVSNLSERETLLIEVFRNTDEVGKMHIIQVAMNEKERFVISGGEASPEANIG